MDGAFETAVSPGPSSFAISQRQRAQLAVPVAAAALVVGGIAGALGWGLTRPEAPAEAVGRFVITTPAEGPLISTIGWTEVAISPDGTRIAYGSASGPGAGNLQVYPAGSLQIYVREIDQLEATVLRGAEVGGTAPFFSPDGQSVGFLDVDERALKRVPFVGGTPQTIGTFDTLPVGMEWAPDDSILFSFSDQRGGLVRVPAGGGAVETLTTVNTDAGDVGHAFPDVLPNGQNALFAIQGTNGWRLAVVSLATGAITDLQLAGFDPTYSPTGHIVYSVLDGTLRAIGFDADRLTLTTRAPVTVLENVNTRPAGQRISGCRERIDCLHVRNR